MCDTLKEGLGDANAWLTVYIANRPAFVFSCQGGGVYPMQAGEIAAVGQACGNGWRKVFNVYAKLVYALAHPRLKHADTSSWQQWRDRHLLQSQSDTALLFTPYQSATASSQGIHLIMGRTYARSLSLPAGLTWLDDEFAIDWGHRLIVCPYFDYRQLSDIKIIRLVALIHQLVDQSLATAP